MSEHTNEYLDDNSAIGFTDQRGNAWWWRKGMKSHHPGAVPVDVARELFRRAVAVLGDVWTSVPGGEPFMVPNRKTVIIPGYNNCVPSVPTDDFVPHQYEAVVLEPLLALCNGIGIASVGVLKHGARAYCQLEYPNNESANAANGAFKFRPGLLAGSSLDGSIKTIFKQTGTAVVCDNTFAWALGDFASTMVKIKHTKHSMAKFRDSGEAIKALHDLAEQIGYVIEKASRRVVTESQFQEFLLKLVPDPLPNPDNTRGQTMATNKRNTIDSLYHTDERAATWQGSVLGVMQAVNTYNQHESIIRNADHRAERFGNNLLTGKLEELDSIALATLNKVLVAA
jgi:phage/plasmid-like protein (TIGR03299 family)